MYYILCSKSITFSIYCTYINIIITSLLIIWFIIVIIIIYYYTDRNKIDCQRLISRKQTMWGRFYIFIYTNSSGSSDYYNNNIQKIRSDRFHRVKRTLICSRTTYSGRGGIRETSSQVIRLETLTLQTAV